MGRSTKLNSNPSLAKDHAEGAQVAVIQILAHKQYGAIAYRWPRLWVFHDHLAKEAYSRLRKLHKQVLHLPTEQGNARNIFDMKLLCRVYAAGSEMVSNSVRAVQHLAEEMERTSKQNQLKGTTAEERIKEATAYFNLDSYQNDTDYQGFVELLRVRDAVEHPKQANVYQGDQNRWDEVPLAWMLSDRSLEAFDRYSRWIKKVAEEWESYVTAHPEPATLTVERGMESLLQTKKPPAGSS